jgi:hypothetical protein
MSKELPSDGGICHCIITMKDSTSEENFSLLTHFVYLD